MNPKIFGWQHLLYELFFIIFYISIIIIFVKLLKTEKAKNIFLKAIAGVLLALVLWNRILVALRDSDPFAFIPSTFCGLSSFILPFGIFFAKKDCYFFHFVCYLAFIGSLLNIIYPEFIGQASSIFYPLTISGLLHHSIAFITVILMVISNWFVPTIKKWYCFPLGMCCVMTYGLFVKEVFNLPYAMNIDSPLIEGTIFTWWFVGLLSVIFSIIVMIIFDYFRDWRYKLKSYKENKKNND